MKRFLVAGIALLLAATNALAMDMRQGFGKYRFGDSCGQLFAGPTFAVERAQPVWNPQAGVFGMEYDPELVARGPFVLHYDKEEKPSFEGVPLGRVFYGCDKATGRFSLVVLSHDLLTVEELTRRTTARLGTPTLTTMVQTIWSLPDLYVQIDQVFMIIYARRAGKP